MRRRALLPLPLACLAARPAFAATGRATLTVAAFPDLDRSAKIAIEAWAASHPQVDVRLTTRAFDDHHTAMTTAIATGANLPDVMAVDMDYLGKFTQAGGLDDLDARLGALGGRLSGGATAPAERAPGQARHSRD